MKETAATAGKTIEPEVPLCPEMYGFCYFETVKWRSYTYESKPERDDEMQRRFKLGVIVRPFTIPAERKEDREGR